MSTETRYEYVDGIHRVTHRTIRRTVHRQVREEEIDEVIEENLPSAHSAPRASDHPAPVA